LIFNRKSKICAKPPREEKSKIIMLASFIISLQPHNPTKLAPHIGRSLHGLFFELVGEADPLLAKVLHEPLRMKPFTVSSLKGEFEPVDGRRVALPSNVYQVRYTVLLDRVFDALGEELVGRYLGKKPVTLSGQPFNVVEVEMAPRSRGKWLQTTSYKSLLRRRRKDRQLTLLFASPTAFKNNQLTALFPSPYSVFGRYYRTWQAFAEPAVHLSKELMAFIDESVAVSRYELQTRVIQAGRHKLLGFTGHCTYRVMKEHPVYVRELNALADLALFCGTGMKTTQGMGQTRRILDFRF